ncbi:lipase 3-like [Episyrphus balteatus]|uniref:lipase 3-like n=1 Tax=Episyrphus balteatus TaxID=286459 RepID=UPI00248557DB|nr:lipase 3-like [Episyrphus balteatus]
MYITFLTIIIANGVQSQGFKGPNILYTTAQRIAGYNYPVESHEVVTSDGYILTMFRIPYSPKEHKNDTYSRPVFLLQHGLSTSSDSFILNGPDNALAYLLADAGYDVWMGNHRGNVYSRKHVKLSPEKSKFWQFTWHELGILDMPAMIDYVLAMTNQEKLHFVGHSQGTTVFFVLLSELPEYNSKFKTTYMLAPIAFVGNVQSLIGITAATIITQSPILSHFLEGHEFIPMIVPVSIFTSELCAVGSWFQWICADVFFIIGGWDSKHLNYTLIPDAYETHPAGCSTGQEIHYLQELKSGYFRKFDHGRVKNLKVYGQATPPNYNESNIVAPVRFYHGDNDKLAPLVDVKRMEKLLPNLVESYDVPVKEWTHIDFIFALDVKELINDKIIRTANHYEKTGEQLK